MEGGTKRRKSFSYLPPAQWFLSYPYEVGKVQEEKNNPRAKCNKLWARQEVQDAAEWVSSHGIGMRVSFLSLGRPPNSSHLQVHQMRIFLATNSAHPTWTSSFHDLLLTILSEVSTQTPHRSATGAPILTRSILRKGSGKKGGLFPHYCFKSSTSFAAPAYKRKTNKASWQHMIKADTSGPPKPRSGVLVSNRWAKHRGYA